MTTKPDSIIEQEQSELYKTAPESIRIQISDDASDYSEPFPTPSQEEMTWCEDSVMDCEVAYVRSDLVKQQIAQARQQGRDERDREVSEQEPFSYVYRYPDGYIRDSNGREINGSKAIEAIALYRSPMPAAVVPDGWKLVPLEPTRIMAEHAALIATQHYPDSMSYFDVYRAMLAAAPAQQNKD